MDYAFRRAARRRLAFFARSSSINERIVAARAGRASISASRSAISASTDAIERSVPCSTCALSLRAYPRMSLKNALLPQAQGVHSVPEQVRSAPRPFVADADPSSMPTHHPACRCCIRSGNRRSHELPSDSHNDRKSADRTVDTGARRCVICDQSPAPSSALGLGPLPTVYVR